MLITTKILGFFIIVPLTYGCITSKEVYYSYKVDTYAIDTVKHFFYSNDLISFGDYLFEFKKRTNINRVVNKDIDSSSIKYDTVGVYLLSNKKKLYYEFDTFSLKNKVVKIDKLKNKPFGQGFTFSDTEASSDLSYTTPKKMEINNIDCFISEIVSSNRVEKDSINQKIILIKNRKFNSLYKVSDIKFPDSNYCIVGFRINNLIHKQSFLQEIEAMRPLTAKEIEICADMVKRSMQANVDTTKGFY